MAACMRRQSSAPPSRAGLAPCLLLLLSVLRSCDGWSFYDFMQGEWQLERVRAGVMTRARYTLSSADGGDHLEGSYFEYPEESDGDDESVHSNLMHVRVDFSDAELQSGSFKLARRKAMTSEWDEAGDSPAPVPVSEPELRAVFEFAFSPRQGGDFFISESRWLGSSGGSLQFVTIGADAFVISQMSCAGEAGAQVAISTWTASRIGAPRPSASPAPPREKKTLWQRYGYTLTALTAYCGYRALKKQRN